MKEPKEHDVITLNKEIHRDGYIIPKGEQGTIIHIYQGHRAYEVEFLNTKDEPLVTIYPDELSHTEQSVTV